MEFSDDAEETFGHALDLLQVKFVAYDFIVNQRPKPCLIISLCIKLDMLTNQIPVCLAALMLIFFVGFIYRSKEWSRREKRWHFFRVADNPSGGSNPLITYRFEKGRLEAQTT